MDDDESVERFLYRRKRRHRSNDKPSASVSASAQKSDMGYHSVVHTIQNGCAALRAAGDSKRIESLTALSGVRYLILESGRLPGRVDRRVEQGVTTSRDRFRYICTGKLRKSASFVFLSAEDMSQARSTWTKNQRQHGSGLLALEGKQNNVGGKMEG
ncbi:hypothetical protein QQ045_029828 [Rhodiola kirilowii]